MIEIIQQEKEVGLWVTQVLPEFENKRIGLVEKDVINLATGNPLHAVINGTVKGLNTYFRYSDRKPNLMYSIVIGTELPKTLYMEGVEQYRHLVGDKNSVVLTSTKHIPAVLAIQESIYKDEFNLVGIVPVKNTDLYFIHVSGKPILKTIKERIPEVMEGENGIGEDDLGLEMLVEESLQPYGRTLHVVSSTDRVDILLKAIVQLDGEQESTLVVGDGLTDEYKMDILTQKGLLYKREVDMLRQFELIQPNYEYDFTFHDTLVGEAVRVLTGDGGRYKNDITVRVYVEERVDDNIFNPIQTIDLIKYASNLHYLKYPKNKYITYVDETGDIADYNEKGKGATIILTKDDKSPYVQKLRAEGVTADIVTFSSYIHDLDIL